MTASVVNVFSKNRNPSGMVCTLILEEGENKLEFDFDTRGLGEKNIGDVFAELPRLAEEWAEALPHCARRSWRGAAIKALRTFFRRDSRCVGAVEQAIEQRVGRRFREEARGQLAEGQEAIYGPSLECDVFHERFSPLMCLLYGSEKQRTEVMNLVDPDDMRRISTLAERRS